MRGSVSWPFIVVSRILCAVERISIYSSMIIIKFTAHNISVKTAHSSWSNAQACPL